MSIGPHWRMRACTAEQMREIDRRAAAEYGIPSLLLMENAGRAVAQRTLELLAEAHADSVASMLPAGTSRAELLRHFTAQTSAPGLARSGVDVVCGKGNNGGDGFVAARHLHERSVYVRCFLAGNPEDVKGDARVNLDICRKLGIPVEPFEELDPDDLEAGLNIDALLGTGFKGEPEGAVASGIRAINEAMQPTVCIDVPSGVDADLGVARGPCVRTCMQIVTLGMPKIGLILEPRFAPQLTVARIGLPPELLNEPSLAAEWVDWFRASLLWPHRTADAHKGESGRLFVLAGSPGLTGAATMVCEAALRAGAGLVTLGIPSGLYPIVAAKLTEAMTLPLPETESGGHGPESLPCIRERLEHGGALAVGPGFGRDPRSAELLRALLADCPVPMVVDADGLTLLSPADERTFPANCVITPHPGEMARLLGTETAAVQSDRLEVAKTAARRFGCVVLLKGPGTVVAAPDGRAAINSSGGPVLATGGTGDVLTGMIGACLSRGLEPYEAAIAGAFVHGIAGDVAAERFGAPGAIAGDVIQGIPEALRRLHAGEVPLPYRLI